MSERQHSSCTARVYAPRAEASSTGFRWTWSGLKNAEISEFASGHTSAFGCLPAGPHDDQFDVKLANQHLSVRTLGDPRKVVSLEIPRNGPFVFIDPGGVFHESLVAANAFVWANEGLEDFDKIYPWMSRQVSGLELHQRSSLLEDSCAARSQPGSIYLPFACAESEGYVPKGLCGDVVLHELTHEMMGRLVFLATARRWRAVQDPELNEALADYFAMALRRDEKAGKWRLGKSCQNDYRKINNEAVSLGRDGALVALRKPTLQEEGAIEPETVGRLISLSVLYGWKDRSDFFETFFDLAIKAKLAPDFLETLCKSVYTHTLQCPTSCAGAGHCAKLTSADLDQGQLAIHGIVEEDVECQPYSVEVERTGKEATESGSGSLLSRQPLPSDPGSPFQVTLKPECGADFETEKMTVQGLPSDAISLPDAVEGLIGAVLVRHPETGQPETETWLMTVSDTGHLVGIDSSRSRSAAAPAQILPNFSTTPDGAIQGWTTTGQPITTRLNADGEWSQPEGKLRALPKRSRHPALGAGVPLVEDPRLEILDFDSFQATVVSWAEPPTIEPVPWRREIDPESLQVGLSPQGPVLLVAERFPSRQRLYGLTERRLAVVERQWVALPTERPGVSINENGVEVAHIEIDESLCKAPPFLHFDGDLLLALTCDGVVSAIDYRSSAPSRVWSHYTPGVVVPDPGIRPIQQGDLDGEDGQEWVLGPFRQRQGGRTRDHIVVLSSNGDLLNEKRPIVTQGASTGSPVVLDLDHDGRDEVAIATGKRIELWDLVEPYLQPQ